MRVLLRRFTAAFAACVVVAAGLTAPVSATEVEGWNWDASKDNPGSHNFPAIAGASPTPFLAADATQCRLQDFCHFIRLTFKAKKRNNHETTFTLTWPKDDTLTDYDMYLWAENHNEDGTISYEELGRSTNTEETPETFKVDDLPQGSNVVFTIYNFFQSTGAPYTIKGSVRYAEGYVAPADETPVPRRTPRPTPRPATTPRPTPSSDTGSSSGPTKPTPESVETPGPDGPAGERGLPLVAAGRQARPLGDEGTAVMTFVFWAVILTVLVAGGVFVFLRIKRDRAIR